MPYYPIGGGGGASSNAVLRIGDTMTGALNMASTIQDAEFDPETAVLPRRFFNDQNIGVIQITWEDNIYPKVTGLSATTPKTFNLLKSITYTGIPINLRDSIGTVEDLYFNNPEEPAEFVGSSTVEVDLKSIVVDSAPPYYSDGTPSSVINATAGYLKEIVPQQVIDWHFEVEYSGKAPTNAGYLELSMVSVDSSLGYDARMMLPLPLTRNEGRFQVAFTTVSTANTLTSGYNLQAQATFDDPSIEVEIKKIVAYYNPRKLTESGEPLPIRILAAGEGEILMLKPTDTTEAPLRVM